MDGFTMWYITCCLTEVFSGTKECPLISHFPHSTQKKLGRPSLGECHLSLMLFSSLSMMSSPYFMKGEYVSFNVEARQVD